MKDSSISKYHLFSGVSVMVIAYLTLTTVVLYLKCFKLYVPDFLDALRTQGMSANMYSDLFLIVFPAVILLLLYVVSFHFSYQYFGVLYLTQEGVLLKAPFKRRIYIPYPEIRELGIDVGTTKQFWIYISKQKIPLKYQHRINQICSSVRHERIIVPYSDKLLSMLVSKLPQPLGKRLNHTTTILTIYKGAGDQSRFINNERGGGADAPPAFCFSGGGHKKTQTGHRNFSDSSTFAPARRIY